MVRRRGRGSQRDDEGIDVGLSKHASGAGGNTLGRSLCAGIRRIDGRSRGTGEPLQIFVSGDG